MVLLLSAFTSSKELRMPTDYSLAAFNNFSTENEQLQNALSFILKKKGS
jgi:hypothetical protein